MDAAAAALLRPEGEPGRDYLIRRGLHPGTWLAWQLGFAPLYDPTAGKKRQAIVVPWFDMEPGAETITAVKYRFIDERPHGLRYLSRRGSLPILFGLWSAVPGGDTLLLVEGEINAISVWQCRPAGVTCFSFGSDGGSHPEVLAAAARSYRRVFVWADDPGRALGIRAALGRQAIPVQSATRERAKLDANALLQDGLLPEFLNGLLGVRCLGIMV